MQRLKEYVVSFVLFFTILCISAVAGSYSIVYAAPTITMQASPSELWADPDDTVELFIDFSVDISSTEPFDPSLMTPSTTDTLPWHYYDSSENTLYDLDYCVSQKCYFNTPDDPNFYIQFEPGGSYWPDQIVDIGETLHYLIKPITFHSTPWLQEIDDGDKFFISYYPGFYYESTLIEDETEWIINIGSPPAPVVPEPVSSMLFITGGALLAGRRYMKKVKT